MNRQGERRWYGGEPTSASEEWQAPDAQAEERTGTKDLVGPSGSGCRAPRRGGHRHRESRALRGGRTGSGCATSTGIRVLHDGPAPVGEMAKRMRSQNGGDAVDW